MTLLDFNHKKRVYLKFEVPQLHSSARISLWLFLRGLALVFLFAFLSLGTQILGLIGSQGILPASRFLETVAGHFTGSRFYLFPTLFWWNCQDPTLQWACWLGAFLSLLLFFNFAPALICALLTLLYLSLVTVGQDFLSFQWDALLIETGILAIFVAPWKLRYTLFDFAIPSGFALFLLRWLLFRLMLESGLVKLLSGDMTWHNLQALKFHFETQPLPTPLSIVLCHLPLWILQTLCALVLIIEVVVPFFVFGSFAWRRTAFVFLAGFQAILLLSGNYGFFNWLTIVLCLPLLDDALFDSLSPDWLGSNISKETPVDRPNIVKLAFIYGLGSVLWLVSLLLVFESTLNRPVIPEWLHPLSSVVSQWKLANTYGLFAVMTTSRQEIILEGSMDGQVWLPYELPDKPGDPLQPPRYIAPFQPRLDWQLWFASLTGYDRTPWFHSLLLRLLQNSGPVKALFSKNPFPKEPPHFVRALLYDYHFTDDAEHQATGAWWKREYVGAYSPTFSLQAEPEGESGEGR